jgi:hypothetical protein
MLRCRLCVFLPPNGLSPGFSQTDAFAIAINPAGAEGEADSLILLMKLALMTRPEQSGL